tara:strand:- start:1526 stop:1942 length:417 start_codon:yes stop_codon:yes gene_type:complete
MLKYSASKMKKPVSYKDITSTPIQAATPREAAELLASNIEEIKGEVLEDEKFIKNLLHQCISFPDQFNREKKGETSAAERKVERHTLKGRTNKVKVVLYMSDTEVEQLNSLVKHRGDRGPSDLVNQLLCTAMSALRLI